MHLPEDPFILLSYINTQLRDFYPSLEELQKSLGVDVQTIIITMQVEINSYEPLIS